ncbi:MAG: tRNA (N6-isopentenyl adenosine(37)-C2)-methylthiotransferase MiaB [Verrucomicrobiota bacterium]|nr:tRNA (N6-isopentenyl adenosine(37)-C2)-methylthiotransferase MiaB [Verrucomicrobiota bacterium]
MRSDPAGVGNPLRTDVMKFHIKTYGCQMNERDSNAAAALLERHGHAPADAEREADVVIVNTCSVRGKAEDKARGKLGLLIAGKTGRRGRLVGAMGCMAQRLGPAILEEVPGLDFAVGTHRLAALPFVLERAAAGRGPASDTAEDRPGRDKRRRHFRPGISAFVNILLGCNRACSYCVVPQVRGREWSRTVSNVVEEVRALAAAGVREVTLLGQSVMSYGRANAVCPDGCPSARGYTEPLPRLLEAVNAVAGIERIRFASGHPSGCAPELARAMAELPAVCEHLHLPLQSGCDRILAGMRRGYSAEDYRQAIRRLRAAVPGIAVTTDIIVGYPTETAEEFEQTRRFMDEIGFDNAFIFKYSPRPGTPAAEEADDAPAAEKRRRNQTLLDDQNRRNLAIHRALVGRQLEALVEGVSPRNERRWTGRTRTNKVVVFEPVPGLAPGSLVNVEIRQAWAQTLFGVVAGGAAKPESRHGSVA